MFWKKKEAKVDCQKEILENLKLITDYMRDIASVAMAFDIERMALRRIREQKKEKVRSGRKTSGFGKKGKKHEKNNTK